MKSSIYLGRELKPERVWVYLIRAIVRVLTWPFYWFPETALKQHVRRLVLHFQNSLPIELAVSCGETAVQIGTPRPRTVRRFCRAVGRTGRVIVFEAEPNNFARLKEATEREGLANVILIPAAAWCESGDGELLISPFSGDHKVGIDGVRVDNDLRNGNRQMEKIKCRFLRIDDALAELGVGSIDYLSVTVNGGELEVLRGAERILRDSPNVRVYAKGHALQEADGTPLNVPIREWLTSQGFATMKTRGEPSSTRDERWRWRDGDAYAWKSGTPHKTAVIEDSHIIHDCALRQIQRICERASLPLLALTIAVLPLQFLRLGQVANFKISIFHAVSALLIFAALIGYGRRLTRGIHWLELIFLLFLMVTGISLFSDAVTRKIFAFQLFELPSVFRLPTRRHYAANSCSC